MVAAAFVAGLVAPVLAQGTAAPAKTQAKAKARSAIGTVKSVTADSLVVVTQNRDKTEKEWTFVLDKDTKVTKAGKAITATDLAAKDAVTVTFVEVDGKVTARTVAVKAVKKS
jgi:hypothetical protein